MRIPAAERLLAMAGYIPFLWWVPIAARRDSMFCQFHGRQAMVLWGLWIVPTVLLLVTFFFIQETLLQFTFWVFGALALYTAIYVLMSLVGFVKAGIRERYRMPVVADVALILRL
jgi:uncharacterized membrane protein